MHSGARLAESWLHFPAVYATFSSPLSAVAHLLVIRFHLRFRALHFRFFCTPCIFNRSFLRFVCLLLDFYASDLELVYDRRHTYWIIYAHQPLTSLVGFVCVVQTDASSSYLAVDAVDLTRTCTAVWLFTQPSMMRMRICFTDVFFCFFFVRHKNTRQPFSGTAERIFMKLLPNDSGENVVSKVVPKWGLGPNNSLGLKTTHCTTCWWRLASDWELVCWLWHSAATAVALKRHERANAFNLVCSPNRYQRCFVLFIGIVIIRVAIC